MFDNAPAVDLTAPDSVSGLSLVASSHAEGASEVTDTVSFTASSSGLLEPNFGQITLEGPVGTSLPGTGNCNYTVTDDRSLCLRVCRVKRCVVARDGHDDAAQQLHGQCG